jgi:hypothetical protein
MFAGLAAAVFTLGAIATMAQHWLQKRHEGMASYRAWMAAGPPCPVPRQAAFGLPPAQQPQLKAFGGARFARAHGAMQCADVVDDRGRGSDIFAVCQFDHPGTVEVSTRRGLYWFSAGYVSPATISVLHDVPTCVIGASQDFGHRLIYDAPAPATARP